MARNRGFTLIELMIVVVVIGILAAIAFPAYQEQIRKSNRAAAQSYMMELANKQSLYLSTAREYAASYADLQHPPPDQVTRFYDVVVAANAGPPPGFTITATPKSGTAQAPDPVLTLNQNLTKTPAEKW